MTSFGANKTAGTTTAGSSFGAAKTATGAFGAKPATGFGATAGANKTFGASTFNKQAGPPTYQAVLTKDPIFDRIWNLRCAYNPNSQGYKFCYVFYNKRINDEQPQCPPNIELSEWVKIMEECPDPDHLIPTPHYGFEALQKRAEAQKAIEKDLSARMQLVQAKLREMSAFYKSTLYKDLEKIKKYTTMINQSMIEVVQYEEVSRNQGAQLSEAEQETYNKLEQLALELNRPGVYKSAISNLRLKAQLASERRVRQSKLTVDKETLRSIATALKANQDALEVLESTTKSVSRVTDMLYSFTNDL